MLAGGSRLERKASFIVAAIKQRSIRLKLMVDSIANDTYCLITVS